MDLFWLASVLLIQLLAVISPGPDFLVVAKASLQGSRHDGIATAVGITLGNIVHISYCLAGLGLLIMHNPPLFQAMQYLGAAYLGFLGLKNFMGKPFIFSAIEEGGEKISPSFWQSARVGFFVCLLNPKATLFFLVFFSTIVDSTLLPLPTLALLLMGMLGIVLGWFVGVATFFTHRKIRQAFVRLQGFYNKAFGLLLLGLALHIALA